jgi:hypothetical protein
MRKPLVALSLLVIALAVYFVVFKKEKKGEKPPKQQPVAVSKYSDAFNSSVNNTLNVYYALSESFVNWDSAAVTTNGAALQELVGAIAFDEIKKDTVIYQTATSYLEGFESDLSIINSASDITTKRRSFNSFSQSFYDLLRTIRFDGSTVFLQECPMAFNDTEAATWLSNTSGIRNPYLGVHHPHYKSGMLECGETKDSLRLTAQTD